MPLPFSKRAARDSARNALCFLRSHLSLSQELFDLGDGLGRIEPFRARFGAIHNGVAAVEFERVFQCVQPLTGCFVAGIRNPTIGCQQQSRAEVAIAVPPIARAGGGTAKTKNAFPQTVKLGPLFTALTA